VSDRAAQEIFQLLQIRTEVFSTIPRFYAKMSNIYRRPVAVDLFAGAGGFSLGIESWF